MKSKYLIIIVNYKNWEDTVECVQSLINCKVSIEQILVIENFSCNDSFNKIKSVFKNINILKTEKNLGFTGGNNLGINYALENNFEYVILLNNDTIVEDSNSIIRLIKNMDENQDTSLGTGEIFYYPQKNIIWYDGGKLVYWRGLAIHYNYGKDAENLRQTNNIKEVNFISGCFMCIRLKDIPRLGLLNENFFLYLDDIEYSARAIKNNLKLKYFPESVIYHKANGENNLSSGMVYYSIRNRRLLIELHFGIIAKIYFEIVLTIKRSLWFLTGNKYYSILVTAINNYNAKYFGQAPENIK
jgi:hypothetical protein